MNLKFIYSEEWLGSPLMIPWRNILHQIKENFKSERYIKQTRENSKLSARNPFQATMRYMHDYAIA